LIGLCGIICLSIAVIKFVSIQWLHFVKHLLSYTKYVQQYDFIFVVSQRN